MSYVDGFVLAVPKNNMAAYKKLAETAAVIWKEHGALEYRECVADDMKPGEETSFPQSVKAKPDETVVFAWVVYESRKQRDEVNEKVQKDPRIANLDAAQMPFDMKRMIYGGFETLVEA